jgi:hypothetical protein
MALKDLAKLSNVDIWNMCRAKDKNFANVTAEGTADLFTEKGFTALTSDDINILGDFYKLSVRIAFQSLEVAKARNIFEKVDLVEVYNTTEGGGGMVQRIYLGGVDALDPQFKEWNKYETKSPFMDLGSVPVDQSFWTQNFDFSSGITLAEFDIKRYFLNPYGMGQFLAGYMAALDNCYKIQKATLTKELIGEAINNTKYPLKETQIYSVGGFDLGDASTEQVVNTIKTMKNVKTAVNSVIQSGAYNAAGYETTWDIDEDSVCLVRAGVKTDLEAINKLNAPGFGTDIPFDNIVEVTDFGGLQTWVPQEGTEATIETGITDTVGDLMTVGDPVTVAIGTGCDAVVTFEAAPNSSTAAYMYIELVGDNAMEYRVEKINLPMNGVDNIANVTRIDGTHFMYSGGSSSGFSLSRVLTQIMIVHGIQVYQAYDEMGAVIKNGYSFTKGGSYDPSIDATKVTVVDTLADVLCVVMQKGALFADMQNSYAVRTNGLNARTLRQTMWASLPNAILAYDHHRGVIVFTK